MYRPSNPQLPMFDARGLLPEEKRERARRTWAEAFRVNALPILRRVEDEFADLFDPEVGRPNRPVELVLGVLILKEMNDLTDQEALDALEWNGLWWWAFQRQPEELHLCQKTLHNFRSGVVEQDKARVAFRRVTDELIAALGIQVGKQRLDSTHVLSNFAIINRLGLFCETIRVFLRAMKAAAPEAYAALPAGILRRHGEDGNYGDARRNEGPRRLAVVARDVGRLVDRFQSNPRIGRLKEWTLLRRLFDEQCEIAAKPQHPAADDDDLDDGPTPTILKEPREVGSDSLQTPHDPDVTYSGHKGKGYSVQVAETCVAGNEVQLITEVAVTPACESDARATVPMMAALAAAGLKPDEVVADTGYSGAKIAADLAKMAVKLTAPAPAAAKPDPDRTYAAPAPTCPTRPKDAAKWLPQPEAAADFRARYAIRAGIESTHSELKRGHGLRKLRVRGRLRVRLAVYCKALACNLKRALRHWTQGLVGAAEAAAARG